MSTRQLKARSKQAMVMPAEESDDSSSEDDAPAPAPKPSFASLMCMDGGDDDEQPSSSDEDGEQPVPAAPAAPAPTPAAADEANDDDDDDAPTSNRRGKKKKKKKAAAASAAAEEAAAAVDDEELEVLEAAAAANAVGSRAAAIAAIWHVNAAVLDADAEMRKRFGGRAVRAAQREALGPRAGHGRGERAAPPPRRVLFVAPKSDWGRPHGLLKMTAGERVSCATAEDAVQYSFSWSSEYAQMHRSFEALIEASADPNMLMELLRSEPCHLGALLQLHEVASSTGQVGELIASDCL